jgi:hypothetical protein
VILATPEVEPSELERRTGWSIKPEGACKGDVCVPLPGRLMDGDTVDAEVLAPYLGMPLIRDEKHDLWCLGPASGGRALTTAIAPTLELPDLRDGNLFKLSSLLGQKVLLVAWASW